MVAVDLYPVLTVTNTPASGLSIAQARLIIGMLGATGRFTAQHGTALDAHDASNPLRYEDAESGLVLRYEGDRMPELDGSLTVPRTLTLGTGTGPRPNGGHHAARCQRRPMDGDGARTARGIRGVVSAAHGVPRVHRAR